MMDNHIRDELAQTVHKARAAIQRQDHALDFTALGWLITFGQDWEALQRETTAWTKVQGWRLRNHLINAYLRKAWQWRNKPFGRVSLIETYTEESTNATT